MPELNGDMREALMHLQFLQVSQLADKAAVRAWPPVG